MSFIFFIWRFDICGLADFGGTASLRVSKFLETVNQWAGWAPFKCKPTNLEPNPSPAPPPTTSPTGILYPRSPSTCHNQPRARYFYASTGLINLGITVIPDTQGQFRCPIVCWSYPKQPVQSCLPSLTLASSTNHNKGSCPQFPLPLKGLGATPQSPAWCGMPPLLGSGRITNSIFNSRHFLICGPIIIK